MVDSSARGDPVGDRRKVGWLMDKKYEPQAKYDAANTVQIRLKLNRKTDADILALLDKTDNKQGLIKQLLREYIKNN